MNILLTELQVIESQAVTKRISGILGETIEAMETYVIKAEPDGTGAYTPITITPVSFDYYGGVIIKGDGVSEYVFNEAIMAVGKVMLISGPCPKSTEGQIVVTPLYKIFDNAKVLTADQDEIDPTLWTLTLEDKNYLYSSIIGTPITGKLDVIGRSFILTADNRIAQITIDTVLQDGDVLEEMTSDQFNARVAEEIQAKIDYFFGTTFATASYNTTTKCYQIVNQEAGAIVMNVSSAGTSVEDLSYFGFVAPTCYLGSDDLDFPCVALLTGGIAGMDGLAADITGPDTIEVTIPVETGVTEDDLVDQQILIGNAETINYEIIVYR